MNYKRAIWFGIFDTEKIKKETNFGKIRNLNNIYN